MYSIQVRSLGSEASSDHADFDTTASPCNLPYGLALLDEQLQQRVTGERPSKITVWPVSYTHLTLPTIYSV